MSHDDHAVQLIMKCCDNANTVSQFSTLNSQSIALSTKNVAHLNKR